MHKAVSREGFLRQISSVCCRLILLLLTLFIVGKVHALAAAAHSATPSGEKSAVVEAGLNQLPYLYGNWYVRLALVLLVSLVAVQFFRRRIETMKGRNGHCAGGAEPHLARMP